MKRKSTVKIRFDNGTVASAVVTTNSPSRIFLTRRESKQQHDEAVDKIADALRSLPYVPNAPLRTVTIR
jgi:hypothetical protein